MARKAQGSSRNDSSSRERARKRSAASSGGASEATEAGGAGGSAEAATGGDDEATSRASASASSHTEASAGAARHGRSRSASDPAALAQMLTPERAFELYKANAEVALEVINAAIDGTSRLRRKQFEGEEAAREFQRRQVRTAAQAPDAQSLVAAQQGATQEAMDRSLRYWNEMFELIVEIQKRLFTLMQEQMESIPGMRETRAAMGMFPDLGEMQKVISAMQGVLSSGTSTFESMQRAMTGFARRAQGGEAGR